MPEPKKRHGCLTAWLILMLVVNSITALVYLFMGGSIRESYPHASSWTIPTLIVLGLFNLSCAVALFQWKKWGFWGICASSVIAFIVNLSAGVGIGSSLLGFVGVALLYGVLQIGKENKGWTQLE